MGAASGKLDALVFMVGILLGIVGFAEIYPAIYNFAWSGAMGRVTLPGLLGLSALAVAALVLVLALVLFWLASVLEKRFGGRSRTL